MLSEAVRNPLWASPVSHGSPVLVFYKLLRCAYLYLSVPPPRVEQCSVHLTGFFTEILSASLLKR